MPTQMEKAALFRKMHEERRAFVMANAWDAGSAGRLTALGFEALGTTSAGLALSLGVEDGHVGREGTLANAYQIVQATHLPVSADLENCFADDPAGCSETIHFAIDVGLAGGSIEDATGNADEAIYPFELSVARVRAAAEEARGSGTGFVLTARAENFLHGRPDLDDTIARLQAYAEAGADVLYAPGLPDLRSIQAVCESVSKPVNMLMGLSAPLVSASDLARIGVARISLGSALARTADAAMLHAASQIRQQGHFTYGRR
ncbi:isocitrate lyase/phosphoenolpyruvate mutase family protein [Microvirga sp. 2YAF29]|uniref:isocitrate lyase/PEP mutase family protein n=1 Tax=Microvirga sp. 2YAF29 TaxID=3233031 RepID=UPI003F9E882D